MTLAFIMLEQAVHPQIPCYPFCYEWYVREREIYIYAICITRIRAHAISHHGWILNMMTDQHVMHRNFRQKFLLSRRTSLNHLFSKLYYYHQHRPRERCGLWHVVKICSYTHINLVALKKCLKWWQKFIEKSANMCTRSDFSTKQTNYYTIWKYTYEYRCIRCTKDFAAIYRCIWSVLSKWSILSYAYSLEEENDIPSELIKWVCLYDEKIRLLTFGCIAAIIIIIMNAKKVLILILYYTYNV